MHSAPYRRRLDMFVQVPHVRNELKWHPRMPLARAVPSIPGVFGFQSERSEVVPNCTVSLHSYASVLNLWPLPEPVSLGSHSPEVVHLACHFTAGEFAQFAASVYDGSI